ncbi:MAG: MFS transporter [Anaerolineales bacterium]|nr:MFS transporter [Anaerolineales bacterium]
MTVPASLASIFLAIEFLDELSFGAVGAAWPAIRDDLNLTYMQVGALMGLPLFLGNFIEPALGLLGDLGHRKRIILCGGICFLAAMLMMGFSTSFLTLLAAAVLASPSSGAFVSLSQATLMDLDPGRRELSMASWTLAGSLGVVAGPILLAAALAGGGSWRLTLFFSAAAACLLVLALAPRRFPASSAGEEPPAAHRLLADFFSAVRRPEVLRWLVLLALGDLMLDVLLGFIALYGTDVAAASPAAAGLMVAVWSGLGVLGDALLIPLLKRMNPVKYLRLSAAAMAGVFAGFLLAPWIGIKIALLALMGLLNSGWYAIPQARLYATLPGRSGVAMAVTSAFGILIGGIPVLLGILAQSFGLAAVMWLLMAGPLGLLVLLPRGADPSPGLPPSGVGAAGGKEIRS